MTTPDLIEVLRGDICSDLEKKLLDKLTPLIERRLYGNVFDIHEAAKFLNRSESSLRRMVDEGEVPYFKQRGQIFFRQTDLDRWIDEQVTKNYKPWRESG